MNRQELEQRLENIVNTIRTCEAELKTLREEKKHRILLLHPGELRNIGTRIRELEDQVEDNKLAQEALKKEIQEFKEKEPEAAKVRDKANTLWGEEARPLVDEFCKMQQRARVLHGKALELDNKIGAMGHEHLRLVGGQMRSPPSINTTVYQLAAFAGPGASDVKPLDAWHYESDEELAAKHKQEFDKKLKEHETRLEIANRLAPNCENCAGANRQTKMIVDRRSGRADTPGESLYHGQWHLVCPKCGATQTVPISQTK